MNSQLHTKIIDPLHDVLVESYRSGPQALAEHERIRKENSVVTHCSAIIEYMRDTIGQRYAREARAGLRTHNVRHYTVG